ncbi:MAG TPA: DinB family protein [Bacteroidia bacterium]|nr:DinB family protein [Bacteroidia bacterium]
MRKPILSEHPTYYTYYINLVNTENGVKALENQIIEMQQFIGTVPVEMEEYKYAEGKWTIKEVLGHICDVERILGYRALCISRGEQKELPGFDEDQYVLHGNFNKRSLYDLAHEFSIVRESNIAMFKNFDDNEFNKMGKANNNIMSVRAILFMIAGHEKHHINVIKERYLKFDL